MSKKYSSMDFYLISSFTISAFIWLFYYAFMPETWTNSFFATTFLIGSYSLVQSLFGKSFAFERARHYSAVFFFQTLSLVGIAFEAKVIGGMYLAMIPAVMGHYHALVVDHRDYAVRQRTGIGFFAVPLLMGISLYNIFPLAFSYQSEMPILFAFLTWSMMTLYSGSTVFSAGIGHFIHFLRNTHSHSIPVDREKSDRLFFHDVINQTHGINLFLSSRLSKGEGVSAQQCRELLGEMRVIQAQIKDHYKFTHKNLVNNYEYVNFSFIRKWIDRTVESFLPHDLVQTEIHCHGIDRFSGMIHYPSFSRIFTNIVKNVSEVKTHEVWMVFELLETGIRFTVKNRLFDEESNVFNIEKKLRDHILNAERNPIVQGESGLGLESIYRLCRERGGEFDFYLEDGQWVNQVFLPFSQVQMDEVNRAA